MIFLDFFFSFFFLDNFLNFSDFFIYQDFFIYFILFFLELFSLIIIFKGFQGILQNKGIFISYLISFELIFMGISIRYGLISILYFDGLSLAYSFVILIMLAAESSFGLALMYGEALSLGLFRSGPVSFIGYS